MKKYDTKIPAEDSFTSATTGQHARWWRAAEVEGRVGAALQRALPRAIEDPYQVSDKGVFGSTSDARPIQDQWGDADRTP